MLQAQASRVRQLSFQTKIKITNTPSTAEPADIVEAKKLLKTTKNITTQLETIANQLYAAQKEESRLLTQLCDKLTGVNIVSHEDKFAIFLNNMGRVWCNTDEAYQLYLINMEDQLLKPIHHFNKTDIQKCQQLKIELKTKKAEYDLKKKDESKIIKSQSLKKINLQKVHSARSKSGAKLDSLESIRNEFTAAVSNMEKERVELLQSLKQYSDSHSAYATIQVQTVAMQTKDYMYWCPPNINNSFGLDSDAEDINDNEETMSKFKDWSVSSLILKQGFIRKRGKVNKAFKRRFFKLYKNKKLVYLTKDGANGKLKGHINLSKIIYFAKKAPKLIEIKTKSRLWTLQFEMIEERNEWFKAFMETKGVSIAETANEWHIDRGMPPPPSYNYSNDTIDIQQNAQESEEEFEDDSLEMDDLNKFVEPETKDVDSKVLLVEMKFQIKIENPQLFEDYELKHETFSCPLARDEIVSGKYVSNEVILLAPKLYIGAIDCVQLKNDEFRQELVDKLLVTDILMEDIVYEMNEKPTDVTPGGDMDSFEVIEVVSATPM